jgi:Tfp pilus assembly protein PilP
MHARTVILALGAVALAAPAAAQAPAATAKTLARPAAQPQAAKPDAAKPDAAKSNAAANAAATPAAAPAATPELQPTGAAAPAAPPPAAYAYQPEGRRDPFLNLVGAGADTSGEPGARPDGLAGLMVNEISVRGVVRSQGALVAAVQGPDNRTYVIRRGDKLLDGIVKAITEEGLTIVQDVNDPLSVVKQREVQRLLRSLEDAK